jgi:parallel beta-helix repeat protein
MRRRDVRHIGNEVDEMRKIVAIIVCGLVVIGSILPSVTKAEGELILRVAMQDDIKTLNPITANDQWTWNVLDNIYGTTMYTNPETDELYPFIAVGSANVSTSLSTVDWSDCDMGVFSYTPQSTWGSSIGEAIIFYDFTNVTWHDGHQMDARDVLFSFHVAGQVPEWSASMNVLKDLGGKAGSNYSTDSWLHVYKVWESPDQLQVALKFVLQVPFADFFTDTLSTLLLPEHIWAYKISGQNVDGAKIWCDPGYSTASADSWKVSAAQAYENNPPIGSGQFEFDFWDKGQMLKITTFREHFFTTDYKFTDYVLDAKGKSLAKQPIIDSVIYKIYKTAEAAVLALKNDDVDYIAWTIPPSFVQELATEPGISMKFSEEPGFYYLAYNMRRDSFGYLDGDYMKGDVAKPFRRAVAHCIDKEKVVDRLLLNFGVAGGGPVRPLTEWHNNSVPEYDFDPEEAKAILANAGYWVKLSNGTYVSGAEAISSAGQGNWWYNPDKTPIGSSAGGKIEILTPEANYDPVRAQAGLMIAEQLRTIGIYAESVAMDFGSIVDRVEYRDFDMYILDWKIASEPADYLWAFFHSSNTQVGQNYPGYQNASFDALIDAARETGDYNERKQKVFDAQASICYDLPYDVLYYRTNIEAYRSDRFIGWVVEYGTIYNRESLINIHPPSALRVVADFVTPPSAVLSNSSTPITVYVRDQDGLPLSGAQVKLAVSAGSLSVEIGNTTAAGKLTVMYSAPYVDPSDPNLVNNGTPVYIHILEATYSSPNGTGYDPAPSRIITVRVFPQGADFLMVSLAADPAFIDPDVDGFGQAGFTIVEVLVKNQDGDPVVGSSVALMVSPAMLSVTPSSQYTDADGKAQFNVEATDLPYDDDSIWEFTLQATAVHPTYPNITGQNICILSILDKDYTPQSSGTVHNINTGEFFDTIPEAINDPDTLNGHTIEVWAGTYVESVDVDKCLTIIGNGSANTTIEAHFSVSSDWVNISGIRLNQDMIIDYVQNCRIENCYFSNDEFGFEISHSSACQIQNNQFSDSLIALMISTSTNLQISGNTFIDTGLFIMGESQNYWTTHTIDTSNTVNGKPVYYWKSQTGGTVPAGAGEVILADCQNVNVLNQDLYMIQTGYSDYNTISGNTVSNGYIGIFPYVSNYNEIVNNTVNNNVAGIYLYCSNINNVNGNDVTHNTLGIISYESEGNIVQDNFIDSNVNDPWGLGIPCTGVMISDVCTNNLVRDNTISNNDYGLVVGGSSNRIYHNNIINNNHQAMDDTGSNFWSDDYPSGGNYWSDYTGNDNFNGVAQNLPGGDGIGDNPYLGIDGGIGVQDPYPLMQPLNGTLSSANDTTKPSSFVEQPAYWHNAGTHLNAHATDNTGVGNVTLWYRFSADNTTWGAWMNFGMDTASPWSWTFNFPDGQGYYEFYSIANDTANNTEAAPATADASCAYDITAPEITDNSLAAGTTGDSYTFRAMATDNLNLSAVHVIYRFGSGVEINATMASTTADNYELGITIPLNNLDTLHYRIVAVDMTGNWNSTLTRNVAITDNDDPVADAGPDQTVDQGTVVTFDGSGSTDNIGITNYTWTFTHNGTAVTLYGVSPTFRFWTAGNYTVTLTVQDAAGNTDMDTMLVNVAAAAPPADTTPPAANAGPDQTVNAGALVTFTGAGSTDNVGVTNYTWTFTHNGTAITLYGVSPTFRFWTPGNYTVTLTVRDAAGNTDTDTVLVTVNPVSGPGDGGDPGNYLWIIILLIVISVVALLLVLRRKSEPAEVTAEAAELQTLQTEPCPTCGFDIEKGAPCPFCAPEPAPEPIPEPEPPKAEPPKSGLSNEDKLARIEKAYKDGQMSEEQYLRNKEKFTESR